MVHPSVIEARLSHLGIRLSRWFKAEVRELEHILTESEEIIAAVPGRYFGGFALLVATNQRLLLIDKRTFFMTVDDIRYDMISEIDFDVRLLDCTLHIFTLNKQHRFTSCKYKNQLRALTTYIQQRVMELRQYQQMQGNNMPRPMIQQQMPSLVTTFNGSAFSQMAKHSIHRPHISRVHRPHLPKRIGFAAMNGTWSFTPDAYTGHLPVVMQGAAYAQVK